MKPSLDRTVKLIWLAIGALLLLLLAVGGVMMLAQAVGNAGAGREAERIVSDTAARVSEAHPVRYGMPDSIRGTATRIVMVGDGSGTVYGGRSESSVYTGQGSGRDVNIMFLDADGVRLLLDRPAYLRDVSYPGAEPGGAPREWISYVVALDDTDRSGRLDSRDAVALYVTDLEGRNLRPVLSPPLRYQSHQALDASRILVYALQPPAGAEVDADRMRQRAFIYDVRSGQLAPYAAMDSAAERAGRILQR
ncbi:MAG TPA: hypothetical protein VEQ60_04880 [Longimicrobium sp.]|nr:hypothetical protein [Longimicrobium sp.]